tara:strand:+ start:391 stop:741 length:351 start_codon:yes stop_codon:yes gene_type:complete
MPKLIALICKKPEISEEDFQSYYEHKHVPLIQNLFPMLADYKRTYLSSSKLLYGELSLHPNNTVSSCDVITELFFNDDEQLNLFMELAARDDIVDIIRNDESNFLDSDKTIMYQVE